MTYKEYLTKLENTSTLEELLEVTKEFYGITAGKTPMGIDYLTHLYRLVDLNNGANFLALPDTPNSYVGQANRFVQVTPAEDGLQFTTSAISETDPIFTASPAGGIVAGDITNWDTAFGWGNHATAGYLEVNLTGVATDDYLTYDGADWVNIDEATVQSNINYWTKSGNNITYNTAGGVVTAGIKRVTHVIGGANFYSGGGDDGGAFTGDYDIVIGEEAYDGATWPNTGSIYHVNVGLGYGALNGSTNLDYIVAIGGGAGRDTSADLTPPVGSYASGQGGGVMIGPSAGRDIPNYNLSVLVGGDTGRHINTMFRSTLVGNKVAAKASAGSVELYKATVMGSFAANNTGGLEHVVLMGHEAGIVTGTTQTLANVIGIGDYTFKDGSADTVITIGNFRIRGGGASNWTGADNTINIGHFVQGSQSNTINWPLTYDMGIGTYTPGAKLHVKGEDDLSTGWGFIVTNDSGDEILKVRNDGEVYLPQLTNQAAIGTDANGRIITGSGGGGSSTFTALTDTPGSILANQIVVGDGAGSNLTFIPQSTFAAASHTHVIADVTDFTDNSTNWDAAFSWGDHALVGYLTALPSHALNDHSDITITSPVTGNVLRYNGSAWINYADSNYAAASHTHVIADITDFTDNSTNWDTAYGWGDHSLEGYLTTVAFVDLTDTPANFTGSAGYLVRVNATPNALEFVDGTTLFASLSHTHAWSDITSGKPTTLSGYGITDAYTKTEIDTSLADKADKDVTVKTETGTTYTLVAADAGKYIRFTNASGCTVTLPNSLDDGFNCIIVNASTGTVTLSATTTLNSEGTLLATQHTSAAVYHEGSNVWGAYGKLTT